MSAPHQHTWVEERYGYICTICGLVDPCFEDERGYADDYDDDDDDDDTFDCGWVRGVGCTLAGSEECDFDCPHRDALYRGLALTKARLAKARLAKRAKGQNL